VRSLTTGRPVLCRFGLPASAQKFPNATAIGFMVGQRSGLTILDVDTPDERVLADALDRHGSTPVIVRSGSGNYQAWYRYNGEKRLIRRLESDTPIDILGSGFVVAPPSRGINADYQFIEGKLDDLDRLPILRGIEIRTSIAPASTLTQAVAKGNRNKSLFEQCMREAHHCDNLDVLLDVARTRNALYEPPMSDEEVVKTAKSAWNYTERGENRFGQTGAWLPTAEVNSMIGTNQDVLLLLMFLRANNGPQRTFMVANGLAKILKWGLNRFRAARRHLEKTHIKMVVPASTYKGPAAYRWRSS
jgi:hypothetical protein